MRPEHDMWPAFGRPRRILGLVLGLACVASSTTCAVAQRVEAPATASTAPAPGVMSAAPPPPVDAVAAVTAEDAECRADPARADGPNEPSDRAVVVVVLDGARWQEVFAGVDRSLAPRAKVPADTLPMRRLRRWADTRGVALGAPGHAGTVRASGPNFVSLPGYTELFTGRAPFACHDNDCARTTVPTVADELRACGAARREVAVFASWPDIERAAAAHPKEIVLSTGRHVRWGDSVLRDDPAEARLLDEAARADPFPGRGDFRPDRFTAAIALRYLETARPRFLFLGLGEPDEFAHRGDYGGYVRALEQADGVIDDLARTLERMGERGRATTVLVTADHGRGANFRDHGGAYPESSRVWLVAFGGGIVPRGMIATRDRRLADVAPTIRAELGLPPDADARAGEAITELLPIDDAGR